MSIRPSWFVAIGLAMTMAAPMSAQQTHPTEIALQSAPHVSAPASDSSIEPASETPAWSVFSTAGAFVPAASPTASLNFADPHAPITDVTASEVAMLPANGGSESVALMIVGGAALVVGSLIDGDTGTVIMVGGGVVGIIGLWRYLS